MSKEALLILISFIFFLASVIGLFAGIFNYLPYTITEKISLNSEDGNTNTTELYNIPAHKYHLTWHINVYGYRYGLFGIINNTGGLHGPNYANISIQSYGNVLYSGAIDEISGTKSTFQDKIELNQTTNITIKVSFTIKDVAENDDFEFKANWIITLQELDTMKEILNLFYNETWGNILRGVSLIIGYIGLMIILDQIGL